MTEQMGQTLIADLERSYGITFREAAPVSGGWLNQKWKIDSGQGPLLVKQYSLERFSPQKLLEVDSALGRQLLLEKAGIPCPHILPCEGHALRMADRETVYMVMEFCPGAIESPETITERQMNSLGSVCGRIHKELSKLPAEGVKGYPLDGARLMDSLWEHFHSCARALSPESPEEYREAVWALEAILRDLSPDYFDGLPKGIAHEDFTPDNMLFEPKGVSAILDFDRSQYNFLGRDIGRAVLSFALLDSQIDLNKTAAFVSGYTGQMPFPGSGLADALKAVWCVEVPWWIREEFFTGKKEKTTRFRKEIVWLTEHWFQLDTLLEKGS